MISQFIFTFLGWLVLVLLGTNLIGMLVRGLVLIADVEDQLSKQNDTFKKIASEIYNPKIERKVNIIALLLILAFLGILFYFWNIGVVIVALIIMIVRIPDLLWEIKYGRYSHKNQPAIYMLTLLILFATLPLLWYVLYHL
ncbi:MAG: hypothetical protein WCS86_04080 [Candidatus Paceibacterota bacterium]